MWPNQDIQTYHGISEIVSRLKISEFEILAALISWVTEEETLLKASTCCVLVLIILKSNPSFLLEVSYALCMWIAKVQSMQKGMTHVSMSFAIMQQNYPPTFSDIYFERQQSKKKIKSSSWRLLLQFFRSRKWSKKLAWIVGYMGGKSVTLQFTTFFLNSSLSTFLWWPSNFSMWTWRHILVQNVLSFRKVLSRFELFLIPPLSIYILE